LMRARSLAEQPFQYFDHDGLPVIDLTAIPRVSSAAMHENSATVGNPPQTARASVAMGASAYNAVS
jgi:hypothetical protein